MLKSVEIMALPLAGTVVSAALWYEYKNQNQILLRPKLATSTREDML